MDEQEHRGTPEILEEDERQGWIDGLRSADAGQRALSAAYLGHPLDPRALSALADADHDVAVEVVVALCRQGEEARAQQRKLLQNALPQVWEMATYALVMRGDGACLLALVWLAADEARDTQRVECRTRPNVAQMMTLDWATRTGDLGMLRDALRYGEAHVRVFVAWALGVRGGRETAAELARVAATDADSAVRVAAATALGAVGAAEGMILVLIDNQLRSPALWDEEVVAALARDLGAAGGIMSVALLGFGQWMRYRSAILKVMRRAQREIRLRMRAGELNNEGGTHHEQ